MDEGTVEVTAAAGAAPPEEPARPARRGRGRDTAADEEQISAILEKSHLSAVPPPLPPPLVLSGHAASLTPY